MSLLKTIFILFLLISSTSHAFFDSLKDSKCQNRQWTLQDGRTQGDGWIWFPGKSSGISLEEAYLKAEGMALERLNSECTMIHKEAKILERCDEIIDGVYKAYVRVSIKEKYCKQAKYGRNSKNIINYPLTTTLKHYQKKYLGKKENTSSLCSYEQWDKCYELGKFEFNMGNYQQASKFFTTACKHLDTKSCFNAGVSSLMEGKKNRALSFFKMTCDQNDGQGCLLCGKILKEQGVISKARKYLKRSCSSGVALGCHNLSVVDYDQHKLKSARQFSARACELGEPKGCYNRAKLDDKTQIATEYLMKGCSLEHGPCCHELSVYYYDLKRPAKALEFALRACEQGEYNKSCHNSGHLLKNQGKKKKAIQILKKSCNQGFIPSCKLLESF
jgi:TPR repeat protein